MDIRVYTLAERDQYVQQIDEQIEAKRNLLLRKRSYLDETMKDNRYLENVRKDYQKYNNYIRGEKEEQLRAMEILKQYTEDLEASARMTEEDTKQVSRDSAEIKREIDTIREGLNDIMNTK